VKLLFRVLGCSLFGHRPLRLIPLAEKPLITINAVPWIGISKEQPELRVEMCERCGMVYWECLFDPSLAAGRSKLFRKNRKHSNGMLVLKPLDQETL
jgi:hypothetical protein